MSLYLAISLKLIEVQEIVPSSFSTWFYILYYASLAKIILSMIIAILGVSQRFFNILGVLIFLASVPYLWLLRIIYGNPKSRLGYFQISLTFLWILLASGWIGGIFLKRFCGCFGGKNKQRIVMEDLN